MRRDVYRGERTRSNKQRYNSRSWRDAFATFNIQYLMTEAVKGCIMQFVYARNDRREEAGRKRDARFCVSD